ncbi:MAG: hypothetical protein J4F36_13125 [Nitrosopumilaceae archaeon]|nr:hypothetical protein [Nitrosopumilaceae archaeon]
MKTEYKIIATMAILVSSVLLLIYQNPDGIPKVTSFEKDSEEIVTLNQISKNYHLANDEQRFEDSKKQMQKKIKEISLDYMGLKITHVELIEAGLTFRSYGLNVVTLASNEADVGPWGQMTLGLASGQMTRSPPHTSLASFDAKPLCVQMNTKVTSSSNEEKVRPSGTKVPIGPLQFLLVLFLKILSTSLFSIPQSNLVPSSNGTCNISYYTSINYIITVN